MRDPRRASVWAGRLAVALAAALLITHAAQLARDPSRVRPVTPGDVAPPFSLPRLDGAGKVALTDLRGQVVLIDFWATWCGPCRASMPAIERVHRRHAADGLAVVSVNIEGPEALGAVRAMVGELGLAVPVVIDVDGVANAYRVTTIPHMVLVDRRGLVREVHRGVSRGFERELDASVQLLLAE